MNTSNYINRLEEFSSRLQPDVQDRSSHNQALETRNGDEPGRWLSGYVNRLDRSEEDQKTELGFHVLLTRGLPVVSGAALARLLDARERKKDRTYREYGGKPPRVASHGIISFRHGMTHDAAREALSAHVQAISDRLLVPIEARIHCKNGLPDHAHMILGTRVVTSGKLGKKCRALDAVAEKAIGASIDVGGRAVGATMEWMRADWAERMRIGSGDMTIDHRSYARRGLSITPVTHVRRADLEHERRKGTTRYKDQRRRELAERGRARAVETNEDPKRARSDDEHSRGRSDEVGIGRINQIEVLQRSASIMKDFRGSFGPKALFPITDIEGGSLAEILDVGLSGSQIEALIRRPARAVVQAGGKRTVDRDAGARSENPRLDTLDKAKARETAMPSLTASSRDAPHVSPTGHQDQSAQVGPRPAVFLMYGELLRRRRMSVERLHILAAILGWSPEDLRAFAELHGEDAVAADAIGNIEKILPDPLRRQWCEWVDEDNAARRDRRSRNKEKDDPAAFLKGLHPDAERLPNSARRIRSADEPSPLTASDRFCRALDQGHRGEIVRLAGIARRPLTCDDIDRKVAIRLQVTGRDRDEVRAILASCVPPEALDQRLPQIEKAIAIAFSADRIARFEEQAHGGVQRWRAIEARAESQIYRALSRELVDLLKYEIDEVWVKRRMRAEEQSLAHAKRLETLRNLRWRNHRLAQGGLTLAIVCVLVKFAILRPLLAHQRAVNAAARADIHAEAVKTAAELKKLRDAWREVIAARAKSLCAFSPRVQVLETATSPTHPPPVLGNKLEFGQRKSPPSATLAHVAGNGGQEAPPSEHDTATQIPRVDRHAIMAADQTNGVGIRPSGQEALSGSASARASNPEAKSTEERETPPLLEKTPVAAGAIVQAESRRLVVEFAMSLIARGFWSHEVIDRLATSLRVPRNELWTMAHEQCRKSFGHVKPHTIDPKTLASVSNEIIVDARAIKFDSLLKTMHSFAKKSQENNKASKSRLD